MRHVTEEASPGSAGDEGMDITGLECNPEDEDPDTFTRFKTLLVNHRTQCVRNDARQL